MPFALSPVKSELDPVRLAGAMYTQQLQRDAQAKAEALEEKRRIKTLIDHTVDQMDANRFRMTYALGKPADPDMLHLMMDDFTITLAAEEADNSLDRTRRHILIIGITVLMKLSLRKGTPVSLMHVNCIQVAAELAMKLLPTYSAKAMTEAALTLNRLWLDHGIKGAIKDMPAPKRPITFKRCP